MGSGGSCKATPPPLVTATMGVASPSPPRVLATPTAEEEVVEVTGSGRGWCCEEDEAEGFRGVVSEGS